MKTPGLAQTGATWPCMLLLALVTGDLIAEVGDADPVAGEPVLSVNEPIYFVAGRGFDGDDDITARFQFSFKYRLFESVDDFPETWRWLGGIHLAYTQTSLWNLSEESAAFEDTSYRPSLFCAFATGTDGLLPAFIRAGYEHESNGRGGDHSRGIDTIFFWPFWRHEANGRELIVAPKVYAYLSQGSHTRDIERYRGYVDLHLRYGRDDGWLLASRLRVGDSGRGSIEVEGSYPIRPGIVPRAGGYVFLQLFHGYGQDLLEYDQKREAQVRLGFAIVR